MVRQQFAKLRPGNWSCGFDPHTLRHAKHTIFVVCFAILSCMMTIHYLESTEGISPKDLDGFFVDWPKKPSPETLLRLLAQSTHRILALDGDKVIGFITAISDGVLASYIPFLEVLPAYQKKGVGSELFARMERTLKDLYMIDVLCDQELQPFYEKLGMRKAVGMTIRRFDRQDGS